MTAMSNSFLQTAAIATQDGHLKAPGMSSWDAGRRDNDTNSGTSAPSTPAPRTPVSADAGSGMSTMTTTGRKVSPSAMSISAKTNGPHESRLLEPKKVDLDALEFTARHYQDIEIYQSLSYMTTHYDFSPEELTV
jgi:hypothetical protein